MIEMRQESDFVNLLKGIGILWVVMGHACITNYTEPIKGAVQITIFFWVAGYTYKFAKYGKNVAMLIGNRVHKFFVPYLLYMLLFLILHNEFYDIGVIFEYESTRLVGMKDYFNTLCNYWSFSYDVLCGPLWFMAPFLISQALYGNLSYFIGMRYQDRKRGYWLWMCVISIGLGILGIIMIENGVVAWYRGEVACLMIPVILAGNISSEFGLTNKRIVNWVGALGAVSTLYIIFAYTGKILVISSNEIISPFMLYICIFCGIYFTVWMAKILVKWKRLWGIVGVIGALGKYSLDIMITHITFYRLLYVIHGKASGGAEDYILFLRRYSVICILVGLICPIFLRKLAHAVYSAFCKVYIPKENQETSAKQSAS